MGIRDRYSRWPIRQQLQCTFISTALVLVGILIIITRFQLDWLRDEMLDRSNKVVIDALETQMIYLSQEKSAFITQEFKNYMSFARILKEINMMVLGYSSESAPPITPGTPVWNYDIPIADLVNVDGSLYTYKTGVFNSKYSSSLSTAGETLVTNQAAMDKIYPLIFRDSYQAIYAGFETDELMHMYPGYKFADSSYTPLVREWYYKAANESSIGQVIITEPYRDSDLGMWMITISTALAIEGEKKALGVVGIDVSLAFLSSQINDVKILDNGFLMLISFEGMVVCYPESWSYLGESIRIYDESVTGISLSQWNKLKEAPSDELQTFLDVNGTEYYAIVTPIIPDEEHPTNITHYLLTCAYYSEARQPRDDMESKYSDTYWTIFWIVIAIAIITFVLISVLIFFVTRRVSSYMKEIEKVFAKIAHRGLFPDITKGISLEKMERAEQAMPGLVKAVIDKVESLQKKEENFYFFEWGSTRPTDELLFEEWCSKIYPFNLYHDKDLSWRKALPNLTKVSTAKHTNS